GIDLRMRWVNLCGDCLTPPCGVVNCSEHLSYRGSQALLRPHPADVHEHYLRRVPDKVIVKSGNLQPTIERGVHHRSDLILSQYKIAHHNVVLALALEGGPGGQTHGRRHFDAGDCDREVFAWRRNFENALLLIQFTWCARELFYFRRVKRIRSLFKCEARSQGADCSRKNQECNCKNLRS